MTAPTPAEVAKLAEIHRITLQRMSGPEVERTAARNAALPPSPLATEMRHADEAEIEWRRVRQQSEPDPAPQPGPTTPWPDPAPINPTGPRVVDVEGLRACHAGTVEDLRRARELLADLNRARAALRAVA